MLYKDDVRVDLTTEMRLKVYNELNVKFDKKDVEKGKFPKFKMVVRMPDSMYQKDPHNPKPTRPPVSVIPLNAFISGQDGTEKWNYGDNRKKDTKKESWIYAATFQGKEQQHFEFTDTFTFTETKIDLVYFLLFISPMREIPGESTQQRALRGVKENQRFGFVVEQKEKEAASRIEHRKIRAAVEMAIMEGLSVSDIRFIGSSMGVSNADTKGELELRDELLSVVDRLEKAGKKGYETFVEFSKLDEKTEIASIVQNAIDLSIIKEDQKNMKYVYVNEKGVTTNSITGTIAGRTLRESLEYYLLNNPADFETMKESVKEHKMLVEADL